MGSRDKDYSKIEELIDNVREQLTAVFNEGYRQGVDSGIKAREHSLNRAYNHGLNDAWECAKKIVLDPNKGGLPIEALVDIFGKDCYMLTDISNKYTVQEVVARITEYEENQVSWIKVGDEVYYTDENHPRVVTAIYRENESFGGDLKAVQITESGKYVVDNAVDLHRTGRHFLQIAEVLADLRS